MLKIRAIHDYTGLCAPSILQYAISEYLSYSDYGAEYVKRVRENLGLNYSLAKNNLEEKGFYVENAGGGYFIWCRLPDESVSGVDFALKLYENKKVALVPGIHFSEAAKSWLRINIARKREELEEGLWRMAEFIQ